MKTAPSSSQKLVEQLLESRDVGTGVVQRAPRFGDTVAVAARRGENYIQDMQPLKAHVHNGRLMRDEPIDLPEGEIVELVPLDEVLDSGGDYLDDEERSRLHASIERGIADVKGGRTVDGREVIARLRARATGQ